MIYNRYLLFRFVVVLVLALLMRPLTIGQAASQIIYADDLASPWLDYSWATVDFAATAPTHAGSRSIAVTYGAWQGLYLAHSGLSTAGFDYLRFFIHGGSVGGQAIQFYAIRDTDPEGSHGPVVILSPPAANTWSEVQVPLGDLGATDAIITGLIWQDNSGTSQPTLYLDDLAFASNESPDGPTLSNGRLHRSAAPADGSSGVVVQVQVTDPQGLADLTRVSLDGDALGQGTIALHDDGRSNDGAAGDGLFGAVLTVTSGTTSGEQILVIEAEDQAGHRTTLQLGAFTILALPGGSLPVGLPDRPAWGSNAWSETPGQDWQVNSGVSWDYVYQYIGYSWYTDGWGGNFVGRFVAQAWDKGYVPVISVYLILDLPPTCGESAACYAQKLQDAGAVSTYLAALTEAATQAQGTQPVIFHLEPDFLGMMQQASNEANPPAGVQPDDPTSYPVALNTPGYSNDLAGFGRRMVDLIHETAPNALVAHQASMWAIADPQAVTSAQAISAAQRTAAFVNGAGGTEADLLFVEWSDRDAGSGLRPWWDDANQTLPHVGRAVLWENALSAASGKRLILWQVPVGNEALDDTCDHYRDNRVAYAFSHSRDLHEAGVAGVLFGAGTTCMTTPATDGGFLQAQGQIAYSLPLTPTGLRVVSVLSTTVAVAWTENTEVDLWGYRLSYVPTGTTPENTKDVGPANGATLMLSPPGEWVIRIAAYDTMGQVGPSSQPVTVTVTSAAEYIYLPLVRR